MLADKITTQFATRNGADSEAAYRLREIEIDTSLRNPDRGKETEGELYRETQRVCMYVFVETDIHTHI